MKEAEEGDLTQGISIGLLPMERRELRRQIIRIASGGNEGVIAVGEEAEVFLVAHRGSFQTLRFV